MWILHQFIFQNLKNVPQKAYLTNYILAFESLNQAKLNTIHVHYAKNPWRLIQWIQILAKHRYSLNPCIDYVLLFKYYIWSLDRDFPFHQPLMWSLSGLWHPYIYRHLEFLNLTGKCFAFSSSSSRSGVFGHLCYNVCACFLCFMFLVEYLLQNSIG